MNVALKPLVRSVRNVALAAGLLLLLAGISTVFWPKAEGLVVASETSLIDRAYQSVRGGGSFHTRFHWSKVAYQFQVDGKSYVNSTYCLCFPVGLEMPKRDESVTVSYFFLWPEISVLRTGPDMILVFFIFFFCLLWQLAFFSGAEPEVTSD